MGRLVRVRGAGAVRVAGDELLPLLAFVVHRVAQRARDRHQEGNERDAEDEDASRDLMMIEGKVRESIYIVKTHTGATQRTNMIDSSPLITHATSKLSWQAVRSCSKLLLVSYMPLAGLCAGCFAFRARW